MIITQPAFEKNPLTIFQQFQLWEFSTQISRIVEADPRVCRLLQVASGKLQVASKNGNNSNYGNLRHQFHEIYEL